MNKKSPKKIPSKTNEHVTESPGARESNAGDDFHILWAARKAVKMLAPNSLLQRIFVEKVSPVDTPEPLDNDDYFLGVDLTEYYEGDDFTSATSTVASQLKYSTRHPEREWTASRLCSVGKGKTPVIRRLADVYRGYSKQSSRDTIISKLGIRLVSNQPVSSKLEDALDSAKKALISSGKTSAVTTANLLKKLSVKSSEVIETLRQASGLGSNEFTDFLRILDLSGCGTETRAFQRLRLIQELSPMVSANPVAALRDLRELIGNETQPEKRLSRGLVAEDVIAALGVSHKDDLFPAQSSLRPPDRVIQTSDARKLAGILESETKPVLAHGDAGVGKTTTVAALAAHLPPESVVIIYDCYGGGNYLVSGEQRHTNNRAFMQLTNEMALRCGTPFLVQPARERYDLQREFRRALEAAAKIVADGGGLLVIAVDAADNAVVAARAAGDGDCFVPPLWTIPLPHAARLLVTSRSHRRQSLDPPPDIAEYELLGFDKTASTEHLRTVFPEADEASAAIFHDRTGSNPRVQFYLLSRVQSGEAADGSAEESLATLLEVSKRTPHDIFSDLLDAATKHAPFGEDPRRMLAALVCLARPLPLRVFANACGIKLETARDFCRALIPGLILEDGEISLRDEDFETFLSSEVGEDERRAAHARLADYFMPLAGTDSYAARAVAEHLYQAERFEDAINLAIDETEPAAVRDQMQRLDVYRRRVELALLAAEKLGRDAEAVRLTMLAAELSRSDAAVTSLVRENPELAALYGDATSVARIYKREETEDWFGAVHLRTAGLYARDPAQHDRAREQLRLADAWLRRRMSLPEHLRNRWDLSERDVAAGAEAVFWLGGAKAAKDWLIRWRPQEFVLNVAGILGASLASLLRADEIEKHLSELNRLSPRVMIVLLASVWRAGSSPPPEIVRQTAEKIDRILKREANFQRRWREHQLGREEKDSCIVSFCELAAASGVDSALVLRLTKALCPPMPETTPQRRWSYPYYDPLRAACLEVALTSGDVTTGSLMPERFRHKAGENQYRFDSERRAFGEVIGKVIEIYKLRARALAASLTITDAASAIRKDLDSYRVDSEHRWFKGDFQYLNWAERATETLLLAETGEGDATERENILRDIADLAEQVAPDGAAWLWKDMAEMLARRDELRPLAYELLERAALRVAEQRVRAQERWELLLRCSEIARRYDDALGRDYYERALSAAEGVNDDNLTLLSLQSRLARKVISFSTADERREFAARLSRNLAAHEDFVSERSRLPWEQTVGAVTRLDAASGAALCSRWDDENLLDVDDGIVPFVEAAAGEFLPPLAGLHLLRLAGKHFDVSESAIGLLDLLTAAGTTARPRLVSALQTLSDWIRRDLPVKRRRAATRRIVEWATANGAGQFAGITELRALESFAAGIKSSEDTENNYSYRGGEEDKKPTIEELFAEARTGSLENLDARLDTVWRRDYYRVAEFLVTVGRSVAPSRRAEFLETVVALEPDRIFAQYVVEGLGQLLREWRNFAPVREWAEKGGIEAFFRNHLPSLVVYEHNAAGNLGAVLSIPQIAGEPRTKFLLPAVIKHFETLGARALYLLAETLAETIEGADLRDVFEWSLDRTERRLEADGAFKNAPPPVITPPFDDCPAVLARFFWSLFGHPDKTVRWRAMHAARGIFLAPPTDAADRNFKRRLLDELIGQINISEVGAFRSERAEFYPLSARVWLLVLLERLTGEVPDEISPHAATLRDLAVDKMLPHAQAREIARRAFLRIAELRPSAVTPEMADEVTRANRPVSCFYPRGKYRDSRYEENTSDEQNPSASTRRFNFDSMDTLPYWYSNVSQIFGEPPKNTGVVVRAERWICDRWGRSESDWWKDPRELGERYKWQEMMNRHGSVPPIENLRTYLEYHAMFCAAGEMVDELPVNVTGWDDEEISVCPWEEWIAEHVAADPYGWLSDLRSPTPHRADCWGDFPPVDEWLEQRGAAEYDSELGLDETEHKGEIVVCGNITVGDSYRRGSIRISSSLVNPETALSLLRALQTASNPQDFMLPVESRGSGDMEIDDDEFKLKAWLDDQRIEKGLEEFDSLARGARGSFTTFSEDFLATVNVRRERGTRQYYAADGERIARLEIWNDNEEEERERITEPFSEGERLWLRRGALLEYLRFKERDLIIEVQIGRNRERRERNENNEEYDLGKSRIYLLRRNGRLETVDGSRQIG